VRSVRAEAVGGAVLIRVETDGLAQFEDFVLDHPSRIVVDLLGVRNAAGYRTIPISAAAISSIRLGQPQAGTVRVVIEAKPETPYRVIREGATLIIIVGATDQLQLGRAAASVAPKTIAAPSAEPPMKLASNKGFSIQYPGLAPAATESLTSPQPASPVTSPSSPSSPKSDTANSTPAENNANAEPDIDQKKVNQPQPKIVAQGLTIIVGDRTLTGPASLPQQRGNRLFLPVAGIARALGDTIAVNSIARSIEVRRQTGVIADFSAPLNQVRENGAVVLTVSQTADLIFPPNQEELMLPVEIISALLDVSVFVDESARVVRITRGQTQAEAVRAGAEHGPFEVFQTDYAYTFHRISSSTTQTLALHTNGRIGDGRFNLFTNFSGGGGQAPPIFRRGTLIYERPGGQRFMAGDFGTGTDLEFMSSLTRGLWWQQPFGKTRVTAFAGRTPSNLFVPATPLIGTPAPAPTLIEPIRLRGLEFDTTIVGSYLTFGAPADNTSRQVPLLFSTGLMYFNGPNGRGELLASSLKHNTRRHHFQGDLGVGTFSGLQSDGTRVKGFGLAVDASESFDLRDDLTLQGRYSRVGLNFLGPQGGGTFTPMNLWSGGVTWRARPWVTTSFSGQTMTRLDSTKQNSRSITGTLSLTPEGWLPTILVSHTQSSGSLTGSSAYTLVNATKDLSRWRFFGNFTRIKIGNPTALPLFVSPDSLFFERPAIPPTLNLYLGAGVELNKTTNLQFTQSFGSQGSRSGSVDWMSSAFFTKRIQLGAGFEYNRSGSKWLTSQRVFTAVELPWRQTLQLTYAHNPFGPRLLIELRGPLRFNRRAEVAGNVPISELNSYGTLHGRVFQDVNLNGRFDPGTDQPLSEVQVRVDGSYYAVSDRAGNFRVEYVKVGEHTIALDLLSVRADLTLLTSPQQTAVLRPGRDLIIDFLLVRTGRVTGVVWLDFNGNGKLDEGETPLADVRIVTGSGRDTLSDALGGFVLGDLPPGEHVILVDEKSLPANTRSAAGSIQVQVKAGSETSNVNFPVTSKPVQIEIKQFPPSRP
jgi:hypothetical protein